MTPALLLFLVVSSVVARLLLFLMDASAFPEFFLLGVSSVELIRLLLFLFVSSVDTKLLLYLADSSVTPRLALSSVTPMLLRFLRESSVEYEFLFLL